MVKKADTEDKEASKTHLQPLATVGLLSDSGAIGSVFGGLIWLYYLHSMHSKYMLFTSFNLYLLP